MGVLLKIIVVAILGVIAQQALRICYSWGGFTHHFQHYPGPCQKVQGVQPGSEDFHTLPNGQTFVSSGLRYKDIVGAKCQEFWQTHGVRGRVYLMDMNTPHAPPRELKISSTSIFNADTFAPHGLSVWQDKKTGRHVVFVVNHPFEDGPVQSRVEKFIYDPSKQELVHQASFTDPAMTVVNDVEATGENSFYFTNSDYFKHPLAVIVEIVLELPLTDVVHFDGQRYTVVDSGLRGPNGIAMSPDGQYVYVSLFVSREMAVYKRNKDNSLTRVQTYPVYGWPDNIQVDQKTGYLYLALHPIAYKLFLYSDNIKEKTSPSQVLQLAVKDGLIKSSRELFYDDGDLISGSSTAFVYDGTLLVSSVFHNLVTCKVNVPLL